MDIRGIWKVKEIRVPTPDGVKVFTPDNPPQEERFEGSAELMNYRTEFAEDGMLNTLMFVPEEMRQEAAKQGVEVREDGYAAHRKHHLEGGRRQVLLRYRDSGRDAGGAGGSLHGDLRHRGRVPAVWAGNDPSGKGLSRIRMIPMYNS